MTVDTKRFRELASRATFESSIWESEDDAPQLWIDNRENNAAWCRAANPQAIIALIDELEKTKAQLAEANWVLRFYGCVDSYFDGSAGLENSAIEDDMGAQANQYLEKWKVGK